MPYIFKYIKIRSTIYTDFFSTYVNTRTYPYELNLSIFGYRYFYINHRKSFVNPLFPEIHTNTIERFRRTLKQYINLR